MSCGACCCKCFLIFINTIILIIGLVLLTIGAIIKTSAIDYIQPFIDSALSSIPGVPGLFNVQDAASAGSNLTLDIGFILDAVANVLIIIGAFLAITALLGCIGACCKVRIVLYLYAAIVLALFLVQLVLVILFFTAALDSTIKKQLVGTIEDNYGGIDSFDAWSIAWNVLMIQLKCCGVDGYNDFNGATKWIKVRSVTVQGVTVSKTLTTPLACCKFNGNFPSATPVNSETCAFAPVSTTSNWKTGCYGELRDSARQFETIVIGSIAGILVLQLLCAIGAIVIGLHIQKKDD